MWDHFAVLKGLLDANIAMASFFSERTAEYLIVPLLLAHLRGRFDWSVPIFFWKSREGNATSQVVHADQHVRVLAVFARRPKIATHDGFLLGKINADLYSYAQAAMEIGIPSCAGFPSVRTLPDLGRSPHVHWLPLHPNLGKDLNFYTNDLGAMPVDEHGERVETTCLDTIADSVALARSFPWADAMATIAKLRTHENAMRSFGPFGWFGGYKPVHVLVSDDA